MTPISMTPWGKVQTQREVTEGITWVTTAGHGGIVLSDARLREMPTQYKRLNVYGQGRYFEEDCEWALVVDAFPQYFSCESVRVAKETIERYYPSFV